MLRNPRSLSFLVIAALASIASAQTVPCAASWTPGFFPGSPGNGGANINAQIVFDDGTGPALYVGTGYNSGSTVFKLTISGWQPVGNLGTYVYSLAVFNDGTGAKLYAGGSPSVSRWNGASWTQVGQFSNTVFSLTTVTVGPTTSLFASGNFTYEYTSNQQIYSVARFTGSSWAPLGPGLNGISYAMLGFNDGTGAALYVGGNYLSIANGGASLGQVAKWNGSGWSSVGSLTGYPDIRALHVFNDGTGAILHAGNAGSNGSYVLRWSAPSWTQLGVGFTGYGVFSMTSFDDGTGPALYAGGNFTTAGGTPATNIARWRPTGWEPVGAGIPGGVTSLAVLDNGSGPALWAANYSPYRWNGSTWTTVGAALSAVQALAAVDLGSGPQLIAAGGPSGLSRYEQGLWQPLGTASGYPVYGFASFHEGGTTVLYACGSIVPSGGSPGVALARWDGVSWSGTQVSGTPYALTSFDDGTGPALFMGGSLNSVAGVAVNNVARWDGTTWTAVGSGLNAAVRALAAYDDGTGTALYIGGDFTYASGAPANGIAKWTGSQWAPVGIGVGGAQPFVYALAPYESVGGPALYVGGTFSSAGGLPVQGIARVTGSTWSSVGSANGAINALTTFDPGDGLALYAGGSFTTIGATSANGVAKWNGSSWSALGSGLQYQSQNQTYPANVYALAGIHDHSGAALWAGGYVTTAGGIQSQGIARYAAAAPVLAAPLTSPVGSPLTFGIRGATPSVPYVLDFSINGTAPGFNLGPVHIPMNEPLVNYTFGYAFPGVFSNFWGYLDANGQATAQLHFPNDPILAGFTLSSSFVTLDFSAPFGIGGVACPRTTTIIPAKPKILTVSPPSAPATGGPTITIGGSGFQTGATVRIGAGYATNLTIAPNLITCTAPAGGVGPVTVRVDNPNGTAGTKSGAFAYVTPTAIAGAAPLVAANGTTITVDGAGFQAGATVTIGGVNAPVTNLTPSQIQCTWPAGVPCNTSLVVNDPDGQSASTPFNPSPAISFVIGSTGPTSGGTTAFILGTNFHPGTTVTIGGAAAAIQSQDLTSILVTVPPGTPGPAPIVVTSASGCTASGTFVYY